MKVSDKSHQAAPIIIILLVIFAGIALKDGLFFFNFQSSSTLAIRSNRWHETVSMPKYNIHLKKWAIITGIQLMRGHVLAFSKDSK